MTDDELIAEVRKHWEHWAGHLGLQNWVFVFEPVKGKDFNLQSHSQVDDRGYKRVLVKVSLTPDWNKYDGDHGISRHVLHETLHVVTDSMRSLAFNYMGRKLFQEWAATEEYAVDELAAIVHRLHMETGCKIGD